MPVSKTTLGQFSRLFVFRTICYNVAAIARNARFIVAPVKYFLIKQ